MQKMPRITAQRYAFHQEGQKAVQHLGLPDLTGHSVCLALGYWLGFGFYKDPLFPSVRDKAREGGHQACLPSHNTFFNGITETVGPNDELMSSMRVPTAQPERYCITISYAVIAIFAGNDIKVTKLEIL